MLGLLCSTPYLPYCSLGKGWQSPDLFLLRLFWVRNLQLRVGGSRRRRVGNHLAITTIKLRRTYEIDMLFHGLSYWTTKWPSEIRRNITPIQQVRELSHRLSACSCLQSWQEVKAGRLTTSPPHHHYPASHTLLELNLDWTSEQSQRTESGTGQTAQPGKSNKCLNRDRQHSVNGVKGHKAGAHKCILPLERMKTHRRDGFIGPGTTRCLTITRAPMIVLLNWVTLDINLSLNVSDKVWPKGYVWTVPYLDETKCNLVKSAPL
jgi:hypothetical protein